MAFIIHIIASSSLFAQSPSKKDIAFIAGFDEGDNTYYTNAKQHFSQSGFLVVEQLYALTEILDWIRLHYDRNNHGNIHIVSHSNPWRGLSLKTTSEGQRITETALSFAMANQLIRPLARQELTKDTKIIFHSCGLGQNESLLRLLKKASTEDDSVHIYASELFNVFGGKYSSHYLAKTYYGYYPTAQSPGPRQLAKEFKSKYPNVDADWESIIKTRTEQLSGDLYTYKFNIPIEWEFEFEEQADIPVFKSKEDIMEWISLIDELKNEIEALQIPIEKFRWLYKTRGNSLFIYGKTTVLCVLQPIMQTQRPTRYLPVDVESQHYVKL